MYCTLTFNVAILGELNAALAIGGHAVELAERLGDPGLTVTSTGYLAGTHVYRGDYERAVHLLTAKLADAERLHECYDLFDAPLFYRERLVSALGRMGRFAAAAEHAAEITRGLATTYRAVTLANAYGVLGVIRLARGDWGTARQPLEQAIAVARTANLTIWLPNALAFSAVVLARLGEAAEAAVRIRESESLLVSLTAKGSLFNGGASYNALARTQLLLGHPSEAHRLGEQAIANSPEHFGFLADTHHLLGDVASHPDRFDAERAETHYRQALALAEPRGMRPLIAHCHVGLGRLYGHLDKRAQATEHLTTATTMYRDMDMPFFLGEAEAEIAGRD